MKSKDNKGISIRGNSVNIGGDVVGNDKITYVMDNSDELEKMFSLWEKRMKEEVDKTKLSAQEKDEVKERITEIKSTAIESKNPTRLEKLINMLAIMSPDIFDVVITTLTSPLAGIGLTIRKISEKAKIESLSR
jgi:uncharacterized Ntn-hydrolase superfamily protein